ncbi:MAG: hypothetical protein A2X61_14910 [Ignavibacteria bacterium GWB2_35_12]|nr:MAG: hypothetical protein A2X63_10960 [Ignavibacteria bacterium GWA2_35_8]OGU38370.1 MAG: hypothetical protein A2X61_14910 [Ignavibacteria bacterium GWB2_35_12]OGU94181.1 MAG: hypothetical protein A2220_01605 [Ignavibacteria bacterium RIFOXYA2_FULL_35_10]OGV23393.1 MAG: hypothetical protein A2475_06345 [Ignavibacteria bacterium RIFOXYC2_FULL_35_21]
MKFDKDKIKTSSIFWGVFLIFLGLFFLLNELSLWNYDLSIIQYFWPLLLVIWGISILKIPGIAKKILASLAAILLALFIMSLVTHHWSCNVNHNIVSIFAQDDSNIPDDSIKYELVLNYPYDSLCKAATLNFDAGAGSFRIKDTCSGILEVYSYSKLGDFELNNSGTRENVNLNLDMSLDKFWKKNKMKRKAEIKFSPVIPWDLNLNIGASNFDCDLSKYKIKNLNIDGGASNIEIMLGDLYDTTNVNIEVGASNIEIAIPSTSACQIVTSTGLSQKDFSGFKRSEDTYTTENFYTSKKRIFLNLSGGVSSFEVKRY